MLISGLFILIFPYDYEKLIYYTNNLQKHRQLGHIRAIAVIYHINIIMQEAIILLTLL